MPTHLCNHSIQWKELFAIYLACALWGHLWPGKKLIFHTDNSTNVAIWSCQSSKAHDLMDLARKIFLISAQHAFVVQFKHIPGISNPIADALSRLQMEPRPLISALIPQLRAFGNAAVAPSTRLVYDIGIKKFNSFCEALDVVSFPPAELVLCLFAANLAQTVAFKTVKLYITGVKFHNIELGFKDKIPKMTQLQLTLRRINGVSAPMGLVNNAYQLQL